MKIRQVLLLSVATLAMAGCVMQPAAYREDRYEDGSYYSAGDGDGGDYYYAAQPREDFYPPPGFYGLGYSGYCPVRYRYCPTWFGFGGAWVPGPGWRYDPFFEPYYDPWYRPYPRRHEHRRPPTRPMPPPVAQGPWSRPGPGRQQRSSDEPARPRIEPEPQVDGSGERRRGRPPVERSSD